MQKLQHIIIFFLILPLCSNAQQSACGGGRYHSEIFDVDPVVETVTFGENTTFGGTLKQLKMDVYQPKDDTADKRAAVVFGFGGGFIAGDRSQVKPFCEDFARRGYVAAAIDYRLYDDLLNLPDSFDIMDVVMKAVGDMKAAVRHLRKDAATDNNFRIDPDYILAGGVSAGAVTAMHVACVDSTDNLAPFILDAINNNGGLEGDTGDNENMQYSSEVLGAISIMGGLFRKSVIDVNDPPVFSMHGTDDGTVPFMEGKALVQLGPIIFINQTMHGSGALHPVMDALGIANQLLEVPGGGHGDFLNDQTWTDQLAAQSNLFMHNNVLCPGVSTTSDIVLENFGVYPNPAHSYLTVQWESNDGSATVTFTNTIGQIVVQQQITNGSTLDISAIQSGIYFVRIEDGNGKTGVEKVVIW